MTLVPTLMASYLDLRYFIYTLSLNPVNDKPVHVSQKTGYRYFLDEQMGSPEVGNTMPIFPSLLDNSLVNTHAKLQVFFFFLYKSYYFQIRRESRKIRLRINYWDNDVLFYLGRGRRKREHCRQKWVQQQQLLFFPLIKLHVYTNTKGLLSWVSSSLVSSTT